MATCMYVCIKTFNAAPITCLTNTLHALAIFLIKAQVGQPIRSHVLE